MHRWFASVAVVLAASSACGQSGLPTTADGARELRDNVVAWSQHLADRDREPIDEAKLTPIVDYLQDQRWPDPDPGQRKGRLGWGVDDTDPELKALSHGLSWLGKAFVAERPGYATLREAAEEARFLNPMPHDLRADNEDLGFEVDPEELARWHDEWADFLERTGFVEAWIEYGERYEVTRLASVDRDMIRCVWLLLERALDEGDFDRALAIARSMIVAGRAQALSDISGWLIAHSFEYMAMRAFIDRADALSDEQWAAVDAIFAQSVAQHTLAPVLSKYMMVLEELDLARDPGWDGYEDYPPAAIEQLIKANDAARALAAEYVAAELKGWRAIRGADASELAAARLTLASVLPERGVGQFMLFANPARALLLLVTSNTGGMSIPEHFDAFAKVVARGRVPRLVIALHRHRLAHGGWPDSLDALVPALLPEVPRDPHCPRGDPLRYRMNNDGTFTLWSVGPDGVDNGGRADPESTTTVGEGFDLVLWPRD